MEPNYSQWWLEPEDEAESWQARAVRAEAELAAMKTPCTFEQEDHEDFSCVWFTACGGRYWLDDGTPDMHYKFCPSCGHTFVVRAFSDREVQP